MGFEQIIFYLLSAVLLASAVSMVTVRNPVYAALFLILAFFNSAALWVMLEAEFLGVVLILVYVGAVMVLFLFVIMMLDINIDVMREGFIKYLPVGLLVAVVVAAEMVMVLTNKSLHIPKPTPQPADYNNTEVLGEQLYTYYVYPFEIAAVILLVAIIAAITLTHRKRPPSTKSQNPSDQVKVKSTDRVRIVKMKSESTGGD
ncbi:MAG: NADH-ubiquinone oxidoreductase chain J (EC [uncultured Thiotrichaceae bacterium]|uniref:NADH-quinone oxidoreductase subunit J n=1 Tax=uncultured Thiotrichaceae bacterium TaxID=298394 RepID=A0A6S6SXM1_9GAMM|nr:MAG: NADH-ubiquinone oxidoreductase chain J (EC [uncultured Thiotrichaceae bacterium]